MFEDELEEEKYYIDARSPAKSNWLRYVNCARNVREENVHSFPCDGLVFYMTTRDVEPGTELLTWYGRGDGLSMGITRIHPGGTQTYFDEMRYIVFIFHFLRNVYLLLYMYVHVPFKRLGEKRIIKQFLK